MATAAPSYTGPSSSTDSKRTRSTRERSLRGTARGGQCSAEARVERDDQPVQPGGPILGQSPQQRAQRAARVALVDVESVARGAGRAGGSAGRRASIRGADGAPAGHDLVVARIEFVRACHGRAGNVTTRPSKRRKKRSSTGCPRSYAATATGVMWNVATTGLRDFPQGGETQGRRQRLVHVHQVEVGSDQELLQPGGDIHRKSEVGHAPVQTHGEAVAHGDHRDAVAGLQGSLAGGRQQKRIGGGSGPVVGQKTRRAGRACGGRAPWCGCPPSASSKEVTTTGRCPRALSARARSPTC